MRQRALADAPDGQCTYAMTTLLGLSEHTGSSPDR